MYYKIPFNETQAHTEEQLMFIWRQINSCIRKRDSTFESG